MTPPIESVLPALIQALTDSNRCLLVAQPGAGKTTRVPLTLINRTKASNGRWLLLEPRRAAARLAADYMANQLGEKVGETVGYRVRGDNKVSSTTRLEVITQGILTRILQNNPLLDGVQGIIFDEFHERSLDADLGLAFALDVQTSLRADLKLLVMSATLDVKSLLMAMGDNTPVIDCPGRTWPVTIKYRPAPVRDALENHQGRVINEALASSDGDVLVFLPGQKEINRLSRYLETALSPQIQVHHLHGRLPLAKQQEVLRPRDSTPRRVILSTDIAESSVTVPGVNIVIDAGFERVPVYQPRSGLTRLETRRVNKASADQRCGRAGRLGPGHCYRLWSDELLLSPHREPEIQQSDLSGLAYELLRWGIDDLKKLQWVSPVPQPAYTSGMSLLKQLKLVDDTSRLTALGKRCGQWPTHPRLAALLDYASANKLASQACWLVAFLEEDFNTRDIDLGVQLNTLTLDHRSSELKRWTQAARLWAKKLQCSLEPDDFSAAASLLAIAYPDRIAERRGKGRFRLATGGQAQLAEQHPLAQSDFLVVVELDGESSGARIYSAISITSQHLEALFPESHRWIPESRWDDAGGRLVCEEVRRVGRVQLACRPSRQIDPLVVQTALFDAIKRRGYLNWSETDRQLLGRLTLLHTTLGSPWPETSDHIMLATMEQWLAPYMDRVTTLAKLDSLPLGTCLIQTLSWQMQQELNELAPTHFQVPSGSSVKIDYSTGQPILAVKLQEMFGQASTPIIVNNRVPLTLHLLSPARRPVQMTTDLANFWRSTYFDVRKDLKGRYPKHPWPDNPLEATATRFTKRRS